MPRRLISGVLGLALAAPAWAQVAEPVARFDGHSVVSADVSTASRLKTVLALTDDVWTHDYPTAGAGTGSIDVRLSPEARAALDQAGIPYRVVIPDVQALIDAERARLAAGGNVAAGWYDDYKTLDEINAYVEGLAQARPDLAQVQVIGQSIQNRDIRVIRITGPGFPGDRPAFFINGCQHAREWVSPMTVVYIADRLISGYDSDPRIAQALDNAEFLIVPVVNPDGYAYTWSNNRLWRKNRRNNGDGTRGVDLNRNWGYQWGGEGSSGNTDSEIYRGTAPFSEPETQVVRDFMLANPRIALSMDVHSYGQLILSPWGYTINLPPDAFLFSQLNGVIQGGIASVYGRVYTAGPTYTTIYPASGIASDWAYGEAGALGWGVELRPPNADGGGFLLPADQILPCAQENFEGILRLTLERTRPLIIGLAAPLPPSAPPDEPFVFDAIIQPGAQQPDPSSAKVHWRVSDGQFKSATMQDLGGGVYRGTIPPASCLDTIEFYLSASTVGGQVVEFPEAGADAPLAVPVLGMVVTFGDDFETNQGWTVGAPGDDATTGFWERADPEPTAAQPGDDHTPDGVLCFVTGAAAGQGLGSNDVDGGSTTLTSPVFDATAPGLDGEARVSYWRWYSNDKGNAPNSDSMPVLISNDGGQTWKDLELVTENANAWVYKEFRIADFVEPTSQVRLRFIARDLGEGSIVEAAVDDVLVWVTGCPGNTCYPDFDGNGALDLFDFLAFVNEFNAQAPRADCSGDGAYDLFDFLCFVNAFNGGC